MVWMKPSPITPIRKLYGIINEPIGGAIVIRIQNSISFILYDVTLDYVKLLNKFKGRRSLVIATLTPFGGSQDFLGRLYLLVAFVFLISSLVFYYCIRQENDALKEAATSDPQEINTSPILRKKS